MGYWRDLVQGICPKCRFEPPASEEALVEVAEALLGVVAPEDLQALWREANGIADAYGDGIWSVERTIRENLELRSYPEQNDMYMPFDPLFCFADAGNGDLFFFPIQAGGINRRDVFRWDHENDNRVWVASDLQRFVEKWYSGQFFAGLENDGASEEAVP
jgi:hypothetical protein